MLCWSFTRSLYHGAARDWRSVHRLTRNARRYRSAPRAAAPCPAGGGTCARMFLQSLPWWPAPGARRRTFPRTWPWPRGSRHRETKGGARRKKNATATPSRCPSTVLRSPRRFEGDDQARKREMACGSARRPTPAANESVCVCAGSFIHTSSTSSAHRASLCPGCTGTRVHCPLPHWCARMAHQTRRWS